MNQQDNLIDVLNLLPYRREMQSWLINVSSAATGKFKPSSDFHKLGRTSKTFVDMQDLQSLLEIIRDVFQTKGYRTPWDLEDDLIKIFRPHLPEKAIKIATSYTSLDMKPDRMTGYFEKPHAPLVTGLAAFYGHVTGVPVCVLDFDYSNMRGTNLHNSKVRAAAEGKTLLQTAAAGMEMTDSAARIIAFMIREELPSPIFDASGKAHQVTYIPMRVGGDELRIVAINLPMDNAKNLMEKIHHVLYYPAAKLGLLNHPHHKNTGNRAMDGFNAAGTAFLLRADGRFEMTVKAAETVTKANKKRRGEELVGSIIYNYLKPPGSGTPEIYTDSVMATQHLTEVVKNRKALERDLAIEEIEKYAAPEIEKFARKISKGEHFLTPKEIQAGLLRLLVADLRKNGIKLTHEDRHILRLKAERFPAIDYASGVLLERDFAALASTALDMNEKIEKRTGLNLPLWTLGASFHNLGGLNDILGHEAANAVLYHQAHKIIIPALNKVGVAAENMHIAHMGGGEFRLIIQPYIERENDQPEDRIITAEKMEQVQKNIQVETEKLNQETLVRFLSRYPVIAHLKNLSTRFADTPNARQDRRPWGDGVYATTYAAPYIVDQMIETHPDNRGGALAAFIGMRLQEAVEKNMEDRESVYAEKLLSGALPLPKPPGPAPG